MEPGPSRVRAPPPWGTTGHREVTSKGRLRATSVLRLSWVNLQRRLGYVDAFRQVDVLRHTRLWIAHTVRSSGTFGLTGTFWLAGGFRLAGTLRLASTFRLASTYRLVG